jgi:serine/threonine protein kinase/tetratricopeptide (TPR) repeat protein
VGRCGYDGFAKGFPGHLFTVLTTTSVKNGRRNRSMIPEAGQRFGPYEILGRLGSGAMGLVFRAWDARLHREVAIKLLHDDYEMPGMRERFLQEARAASALNHPHICTIFDLGEQDGEPYMVMELLEGETLKEKISRGAVPMDEIVSHSQEVADALSAAHAKGIVHRDVKPANIFLVDHPNGRRQAKVLDFGLAKIGLATRGGRASRALDLTLVGATVGTLSYMSPEQARGQVLDERSDLFSLGVVMYEMATRQVPFQGATSALIFVQLLNHAPEPLHEWNDSIPKELEKIILKLLSKDRNARFQTANELGEALRKIPFRSGGGWLKRAVSAVPLVKAADPVARVRRPVRTSSEPHRQVKIGAVPESLLPTPIAPIMPTARAGRMERSPDNTLIRPVVRAPIRDDGSRDEGVLRGDRTISRGGGTATSESKDGVEAAHAMSASADLASVVPMLGVSERAGDKVQIPARSRSGATQFEFNIEDLVQPTVAEPVADEVERTLPMLHAVVRVPEVKRSEGKSSNPEEKQGQRSIWIALAAMLLLIAVAATFLLIYKGQFRPVLLQPGEPLLLTLIQNRTGDSTLDGSVVEGLELMLDQSQYLTVRGVEAYRAGLRQVAAEGASGGQVSSRKVAQSVGAKAYLYGEIKGSDGAYTISVDVLKTDSNDKLTSIEETAPTKDQLVATIGRIATRVRTVMGEGDRAIAKANTPLDKDASGSVESLQSYALGEVALQGGRTGDAVAAFQKAAAADAKFAQAHLKLAWIYRGEGAETAAAAEGKLAQDASENASDRLKMLAQFSYEMNTTGDFERAAGVMRQFKELFPHDIAGMLGTARVLRAQGHLPEALQAAQQVYAENPYDGDAYVEAEALMVGMDRFQGARELQEQSRRLGVVRSGSLIAATYLEGKKEDFEGLTIAMRTAASQDSYRQLGQYGLALDDMGRLTAGAAVWRGGAASAGGAAGLEDGLDAVQASLLAQAALDRALTSSCRSAMSFSHQVDGLASGISGGLVATFQVGLAAALCGDVTAAQRAIVGLKAKFPNSTAVNEYYLAELQAAILLHQNDAKGALGVLGPAAPYDQISLTPYLRGLAHLGTGEAVSAVSDFQAVVDHRGMAFLIGSNVYPMAELGLARAYAAMGDKANSRAAYQRFATLWHEADHGQPPLDEALAKGR